jgi:uncharacterized membrane protein YdbT with pleckstrin-like domain
LWVITAEILLGVLFSFLVLPLLYAIYKVAEILCWKYYINERTIVERTGVFSVLRKEIHYARIKSIMVYEPFLFRLVGLSNITIKTSDPYKPTLRLYGVRDGQRIKQMLSSKADKGRKKEGIKEFDLYSL